MDDGRDTTKGYCACLHYVRASAPTADPPGEEPEPSEYWAGFVAGLGAAARAVTEGRRVPRLEDFQ